MARFARGNKLGRPFVKTVTVASTDTVPANLQPGQWVKVVGDRKPSRFVQYTVGGSAILVRPVGKGKASRGSLAAFRLGRDKSKSTVLGTVGKVEITKLLNLFL